MKQIKVTIAPDGSVTTETSGYRGSECNQAAGPLERALGVTTKYGATAEAALPPEVKNPERRS